MLRFACNDGAVTASVARQSIKLVDCFVPRNDTDAVNIFTSMVVANKGLPFDVKIPIKEFKKSIDELEKKDGKKFNATDELFKDLDTKVSMSIQKSK